MNRLILDPAAPRGSRRLALAIAVALGSVPPGAALAQQALLEEITVTATRRAVSVQDIPLNISALSGGDLERQRIQNLAELTRLVPGLYLNDQGGRNGNLISVRGLNVGSLSAGEFTANSTGGAVATYLGDIPYYLDLRLLDVDRVEVLLGPQGTLYGAGTLGGAIRYIPRRADLSETTLELGGDLYSYSRSNGLGADGSVVFNLPLVADRLALRAVVGYYDTPGFIDYNFLVREAGVSDPQPDFNDPDAVAANLQRKRDANNERTLSTRFSLLWEATADVAVNLTHYYQRQRVGARQINHVESFGTGRYESAHRFDEPNDRENHLLALEADWDLGFALLTSATGLGRYEDQGQRDQTDLLLELGLGYELFPQFAAFTRDDAEEDTFSQELRLVSQHAGPWNWIAGAYYNRFTLDAESREFTPGIPEFYTEEFDFPVDRPDNLEYYQKTDTRSIEQALFGEVGYQLTERWDVAVGARWYRFRDSASLGIAFPFFSGEPEAIVFDFLEENSVRYTGNLFKFNTSYRLREGLLGYLTISEGFRRGGSNGIPLCQDPPPPGQSACTEPGQELYEPDTTTNHELGLRWASPNGRFNANGAIYLIDWDDVQVASRTLEGGVPITVNGPKARSKGYELAFDLLLLDDLRLLASYALTKSELRQDSEGILVAETARSGDRLPGTPRHQGSVVLNYTRALAGDLALEADYGLAAVSSVYTKVGLRESGEELAGYALHNLALGLSSSSWSAQLYADNLFNKYAETGVRGDRSQVTDVNGFDLRRYFKAVVPPRQVGIRFNYRFDL